MNIRATLEVLPFVLLISGCGSSPNPPAPQEFVIKLQPNGASASLPPIQGIPRMSLDRLGDLSDPVGKAPATLRLDGDIDVGGFAIDEAAGRLAAGVDIVIDSLPFTAHYGMERSDVSEYFKNPAYRNSGFQFSTPARFFGRGQHALVTRIIRADGKGYQDGPALTFGIQ